MNEKERLQLSTFIEGRAIDKFEILKQRLGLTKNSEVLRLLISKGYKLLKKRTLIPIDSELYDALEAKARKEGQTVHEIAEGYLLSLVKTIAENPEGVIEVLKADKDKQD